MNTEICYIPDLEGYIYIREWTGQERSQFLAMLEDETMIHLRSAWVFAASVANVEGEKLFDDEDISNLSHCSSTVLHSIYQSALVFNGLTANSIKNVKSFLVANTEQQFWFQLALAFGCTVKELQSRMSSREFTQWIAYAQIEPFGQARADLRSGIIASVLANVNRDPKKRSEPFTPEDFMPKFTEPKAESHTDNTAMMKAMMETWVAAGLASKIGPTL